MVSSEGKLPSIVLLVLLAWVYSCSAVEPEFLFKKLIHVLYMWKYGNPLDFISSFCQENHSRL